MEILEFNQRSSDGVFNDTIDTVLFYCTKDARIISANEVVIDWILKLDWFFTDSNNGYSLEIESVYRNCFGISYETITKSKEEYRIRLTFNPSNINMGGIQRGGNIRVQYCLKFLKDNRVKYTSLPHYVGLEVRNNCTQCADKSYYRISKAVNNGDSIVFTDSILNRGTVHIADLHFDITGVDPVPDIGICDLRISIQNGNTGIIPIINTNDNFDVNNGVGGGGIYHISPRDNVTNVGQGSIPIYIPVNCIVFPDNGEMDDLVINYSFNYDVCGLDIATANNTEKIPLRLSPDYVRLAVNLSEEDLAGNPVNTNITSVNAYNLSDILLINGGEVNVGIEIKNAASRDNQNINTQLRISGVRTTIINNEDDLNRIEGDLQAMRGDLEIDMPDQFGLNAGESTSLNLVFDMNSIGNIAVRDHNGVLYFQLSLMFEYIEERVVEGVDQFGQPTYRIANSVPSHYECILAVNIHRKDPELWHSVDFGTSAVVACCLNRNNHTPNPDVLDLKIVKNRLLKDAIKDEVRSQDYSEPTQGLIASTLYFNSVQENVDLSIDSNFTQQADYADLPLWFSPGSEMVDNRYRLPCLKNMMGHKNIPVIPAIPDYAAKYSRIEVNDVMKYSYNQLFKYYINGNNVEALALTIPNTFTPVHVAQLKKVVLDNLPTLREDMLEFVSESDSVLCSYVRRKMQEGHFSQVKVLVYDMGAGTLDLTLAECSYTATSGCNIDIKMKIGVNKAGNYIDYLLGEIICDLLKVNGNGEWADLLSSLMSITPVDNDMDPERRKILKDYLKNEVKTKLNEPETSLPVLNLGGNTRPCTQISDIKVENILQHYRFIEYLHNCTSNVLSDLFNQQPRRVNVVLLSGRSIAINAIVTTLKSIIEDNEVEYKMMGDIVGDLKTVVAKGALDYKHMSYFAGAFRIAKKKVYGSYGVLLMNGDMPCDWFPIIDMGTRAVNANSGVLSDKYEYDNCISVNLQGRDRVYFCHSYCLNTLFDARSGNYDSISILCDSPVTQGLLQASPVRIRLQITSDNELIYWVGKMKTKLYPRDDYNNDSLRKSLWPVIYK